LEKLNKLAGAWEDLASDKTFGGMTFTEFTAKVKPSLDARDAIQLAEPKIVDALTDHQLADVETLKQVQLVVSAIKGDPAFGEDSALYQAAGYVRKSGLTRKGTTAQPPATQTKI
jgi:hypothetical protein